MLCVRGSWLSLRRWQRPMRPTVRGVARAACDRWVMWRSNTNVVPRRAAQLLSGRRVMDAVTPGAVTPCFNRLCDQKVADGGRGSDSISGDSCYPYAAHAKQRRRTRRVPSPPLAQQGRRSRRLPVAPRDIAAGKKARAPQPCPPQGSTPPRASRRRRRWCHRNACRLARGAAPRAPGRRRGSCWRLHNSRTRRLLPAATGAPRRLPTRRLLPLAT